MAERNILNQVFVKKAWGWTSGAFALLLLSKPRRPSTSILSDYFKPLLRYALATAYWLLFTTWFFGPGITDRVLMSTGATCLPTSQLSALQQSSNISAAVHPAQLEHEHCLSGSAARKALREQLASSVLSGSAPDIGISPAYWSGGHDISGHTFLLVHASLFLLVELAPLFSDLWRARTDPHAILAPWRRYAIWTAAALMGLWWVMLIATSIYFHTAVEKLSGFAVGVAEVLVVQYLVGV